MDTTNNNTDKSANTTIKITQPTNSTVPKISSNQNVRHESAGHRPSSADSARDGVCYKESQSTQASSGGLSSQIDRPVDEGIQRANQSNINTGASQRSTNIDSSPVHEKPSSVCFIQDEERLLSNSSNSGYEADSESRKEEKAKEKQEEEVIFDPWLDAAPPPPQEKPKDNYEVGDLAAPFIASLSDDDKQSFIILQTKVYKRIGKNYQETYSNLEHNGMPVSGFDQLRHSPIDLTIDYELPIYLLKLSRYDIWISGYARHFPVPKYRELIFDMASLSDEDMVIPQNEWNDRKRVFLRSYWKVAYQNHLTEIDCSSWNDFIKYDEKDPVFRDRYDRIKYIATSARYATAEERVMIWNDARLLNYIPKFITYKWFCKIGDCNPDKDSGGFSLPALEGVYDRIKDQQVFTQRRRRVCEIESTNVEKIEANNKGVNDAKEEADDVSADSQGAIRCDSVLNFYFPDAVGEQLKVRKGHEFEAAFPNLEPDCLAAAGLDTPHCVVVANTTHPDRLVQHGVIDQEMSDRIKEFEGVDLKSYIKTLKQCNDLESLKKPQKSTEDLNQSLDGLVYENKEGVVRIKEAVCSTCAVDSKIAMSDCDQILVFYYSFKDKGKRSGVCAINKAHYLALVSRGFANRTPEVQLTMLQFTTAYPYKLPFIFARTVATPTMATIISIIQDAQAEVTFRPEKHCPIDSEFDTSGLVTNTDLIARNNKQEEVNCWRIISTGDRSPIMFKRDKQNLEKMKFKRLTPHVRQNVRAFENKFPSFLQKISGNLSYDIKGDDFISYALDRCKAKMLSIGERVEWMANAMCAKELYENDPKGLYSLYAYSLYRCTKCFIKDECYDKTTTTLRNIISPDTFVKVVYGTIFRPYEDHVYYHSILSPFLIKKLNDQQVHDKLSRMRQSDDWIYGQYDSKAFESSYTSGILTALYGDLRRVQKSSICRNIVRMTCTWNIYPKIIRSRFFSIIYEDGQMSGFPHTACWNAEVNVGDKMINCNVTWDDCFVVEGDDFMLCSKPSKVNHVAESSLFETTVLTSSEFSDLSFCGHHYLPDGTRIPDGSLYDKLNTYWCHHEPSASELFGVGIMKALSYSLYYPGHPDIAKFIDDFNSVYSGLNLKLTRSVYDDYLRRQWWRIEQRSFPVFDFYPLEKCPNLQDRIEKYLIKDKFYECDSLNTNKAMNLFIEETMAQPKPWYKRLINDVGTGALLGSAAGAASGVLAYALGRSLKDSIITGYQNAISGFTFGALGGLSWFGAQEIRCAAADYSMQMEGDISLETYRMGIARGVMTSIENPGNIVTYSPVVRRYLKHFCGVRTQLLNRLAKGRAKLMRAQANVLQEDLIDDPDDTWAYMSEFIMEARALRWKVRRRE